jgi:acetoacetyl-CoA synthetase
VTLKGKKVEPAVRNVIPGKPVINRDGLLNPETLDQLAHLPELRGNTELRS